jgi:chemotaxis protein CheX
VRKIMAQKTYKVEVKTGYTEIKLDTILDYYNCKSFNDEIDSITELPNHVLINCEDIVSLPKDWIRAFMRMQMNVKKNNKHMKLIHVNQAVSGVLKSEGIENAFQISKDAKAALEEFGLTVKRTLNMEFINPFLSATIHVLKIQSQTEAKAGQVYMKKMSDPLVGDISGIIGIVSDTFTGSVVISFPEKTFLQVLSRMLGEEITKIDKDSSDGAGELTNMIFGQAKISLNEKGYGIKTAIPSVVTGKDHSLQAMTKGPVMVIPFETDIGKFFVEICLSN